MASIRKLSQEIIGRIAAGEVVERPASVVKEMVENAIDAGATHITVEVREGGVEYLRITDDGKGIPAEEIRMAFERHATSKLQTAEQLFDVRTLGFRGEALASIAAVAKVTCTTKTADAPLGIRAKIEGGEFVDIRQAASSVGTTFVVEDLFFNTPVRRKFLKKPGQEAALVSDYLLRLMLSHPEIAFRFVNQGKTVYQSIGDGKVESVLYQVYGKDAFSNMHHVSGHMNGLLLKGYVGVGELSRGNRQQQSFFINGRYFRSGVISRAVENGCEGRVMIGRFPMCALFLELPYQMVDVNVHPNKLEVRFQNELAIAEAVKTLVSEALHGQTLGAQLKTGAVAPVQPVAAAQETPITNSNFTVTALPGAEKEPEKPVVIKPTTATGSVNKQVQEKPAVERNTEKPVARSGFVVQELPNDEKVPASQTTPKTKGEPQTAHDRSDEKQVSSAPQPIGETPVVVPVERKQLYTSFTPDLSYLHKQHTTMRESSSPEVNRIMMELAKKQAQDKIKHQEEPASTQKTEEVPAISPEQTSLLPDVSVSEQLRFVGIAFSTYWIFECGDKLLLLDQHAAHERMLYDRMLTRLNGEAVSQRLLAPVLVEMTQHDLLLLDELQDVLSDAGFDVQRFDDSSAAIHAIPTLFGSNENPRTLFLEALDEWQAGRGAVTRERMRKQIAQMACKRAIKAGDKLSEDEVKGFLKEMLQSDSMPTCPHGRPIVIEMTQYMLEKRFKRIQ